MVPIEPPESDELQQLARAREEERQRLLAELFERHRARLRSLVHLRLDPRLRGRVDPSDVLQEAYLQASQRIDGFLGAPEVPLFVWLRFLTVQKLVDLHRHHIEAQRRDARREVAWQASLGPQAVSQVLAARLLAGQTSPSEAAARAESLLQLESALASLSPTDREVIALRHFEELTSAETASVLGVEERAASKRYLRALERLRKALGAEG